VTVGLRTTGVGASEGENLPGLRRFHTNSKRSEVDYYKVSNLPAIPNLSHTIYNMEQIKKSCSMPKSSRRLAYTFFEVIVTVVLAGILSLLAVSVFNWAYADASDRVVKLDANTFERNVRSLANIELRAVNNNDAATVIEEMTKDPELSILPSGMGFNVTRGDTTYCVILGDEVNEKGSISPFSCS